MLHSDQPIPPSPHSWKELVPQKGIDLLGLIGPRSLSVFSRLQDWGVIRRRAKKKCKGVEVRPSTCDGVCVGYIQSAAGSPSVEIVNVESYVSLVTRIHHIQKILQTRLSECILTNYNM